MRKSIMSSRKNNIRLDQRTIQALQKCWWWWWVSSKWEQTFFGKVIQCFFFALYISITFDHLPTTYKQVFFNINCKNANGRLINVQKREGKWIFFSRCFFSFYFKNVHIEKVCSLKMNPSHTSSSYINFRSWRGKKKKKKQSQTFVLSKQDIHCLHF